MWANKLIGKSKTLTFSLYLTGYYDKKIRNENLDGLKQAYLKFYHPYALRL